MAKKKQPQSETTELEVPETMHIGEEIEPIEGVDPRKEIMDQIYAKRQQLFAEELGVEEEVPAPQEPEPEAAEEPVPVTPAPPEQSVLPEKVKLKVEGKELEVPGETLIQLAQKGLSSDQRYQEAARLRQEAERMMAQNAQPRAEEPSAPPAPVEVIDEATARELAKRMNYGSEEDQVKAIRDLATMVSKTQGRQDLPTPEHLIATATQNALTQIRFEQDMTTIGSEYKDIFSDEPLSMAAGIIARNLTNKYKAEGIPKPPLEIWREACNSTRERYLRTEPAVQPQPVQAASNVVPMTDKLERKRAAPQPPAAASKVASESPPQQGVNPSSIVQQMRKQRGQPTY